MDDHTRELFGECRSLLAEPPSAEVFTRLLDVLGIVPEVEVVQYAQDHLARWPREVWRALPEGWLACAGLVEAPTLALCDTLWLTDSFYGAHPEDLVNTLALWQPRRLVLEHEALLSEALLVVVCEQLQAHGADGRLEALELRWLEDGWSIPSMAPLHTLDLSGLKTLALRGVWLEDEDVRDLMGSAKIHDLEVLNLAGNQLTAYGVREVVEYGWPGQLRRLDVRHNAIGEEGARAIAGSMAVEALEWLWVNREDVGDRGVRALAEAERLPAHIRRYWRGVYAEVRRRG